MLTRLGRVVGWRPDVNRLANELAEFRSRPLSTELAKACDGVVALCTRPGRDGSAGLRARNALVKRDAAESLLCALEGCCFHTESEDEGEKLNTNERLRAAGHILRAMAVLVRCDEFDRHTSSDAVHPRVVAWQASSVPNTSARLDPGGKGFPVPEEAREEGGRAGSRVVSTTTTRGEHGDDADAEAGPAEQREPIPDAVLLILRLLHDAWSVGEKRSLNVHAHVRDASNCSHDENLLPALVASETTLLIRNLAYGSKENIRNVLLHAHALDAILCAALPFIGCDLVPDRLRIQICSRGARAVSNLVYGIERASAVRRSRMRHYESPQPGRTLLRFARHEAVLGDRDCLAWVLDAMANMAVTSARIAADMVENHACQLLVSATRRHAAQDHDALARQICRAAVNLMVCTPQIQTRRTPVFQKLSDLGFCEHFIHSVLVVHAPLADLAMQDLCARVLGLLGNDPHGQNLRRQRLAGARDVVRLCESHLLHCNIMR